jgi:hypothetical protein
METNNKSSNWMPKLVSDLRMAKMDLLFRRNKLRLPLLSLIKTLIRLLKAISKTMSLLRKEIGKISRKKIKKESRKQNLI